MHYKVSTIIEKDEDGYYAYCPYLEGCQNLGDSLKEVKKIPLFPQGELNKKITMNY